MAAYTSVTFEMMSPLPFFSSLLLPHGQTNPFSSLSFFSVVLQNFKTRLSCPNLPRSSLATLSRSLCSICPPIYRSGAMHLLSLPDQALISIFRALGNRVWTDDRFWSDIMATSADARSMASCCTHLNRIHRDSVRTLTLKTSCTPSDCSRILSRYSHISTLNLSLSLVPGFELSLHPAHGGPKQFSGAPVAFPNCLLTEQLKSLSLHGGAMSVLRLRAILNKCTRLKTMELCCSLFHDRASKDFIVEDCSFSLERHASSLQRIFVWNYCYEHVNSTDLRWLALSSLSGLKSVKFARVKWHSDGFRGLANAASLESIDLSDVGVCDEDLEAVLPFLVHLHSVRLDCCKKLSGRMLAWLPQNLKLLDVSGTSILSYSVGRVSARCSGTRKLKTLVARSVGSPAFELFLEFVAGPSIESIELSFCRFRTMSDLIYLLERTSSLKLLNIQRSSGVHVDRFENISRTTGLQSHGDRRNGLFTT